MLIQQTILDDVVSNTAKNVSTPALRDLMAENLVLKAPNVNRPTQIEIRQTDWNSLKPKQYSVLMQDKAHIAPPEVRTETIPICKIGTRIQMQTEEIEINKEQFIYNLESMIESATKALYNETEAIIFNGFFRDGKNATGYLTNEKRVQVNGADRMTMANFVLKSGKSEGITQIYAFMKAMRGKLYTQESNTMYVYASKSVFDALTTRTAGIASYLDLRSELIRTGLFKDIKYSEHIQGNAFVICNLIRSAVGLYVGHEIAVKDRSLRPDELLEYDVTSSITPIVKSYIADGQSDLVHVKWS